MGVNKTNLVLVVSGPSGAGKSTLCEQFVATHPKSHWVVTTTTRPRRPGEVNGEDYHFATEAEFKRDIDAGSFLEHALVHGHYYGSPRREVEEALETGKDVILEIDVQGGLAVRDKIPQALLVFVMPSDLEVLHSRLVGRGTESPEAIQRRLTNARRELECLSRYDYFLYNDSLDQAVRQLAALVETERFKVSRYKMPQLIDWERLEGALARTQPV